MSTTRTTATLVAANAAAAGLGYAWTIIAGRMLPAALYAEFSAGVSIIYFAITALAPLSQTLAYFTATERGGRRLENASLIAVGIAGITALAILPRNATLISLAVVCVAAMHIRRGIRLGASHFNAYAANIVVEAVLRVALAVILIGALGTSKAALLSFIIAGGAAALFFWPMPKREGAVVDVSTAVRFFVPTLAYTAVYGAFQNIDIIIVKHFFPSEIAGIYSAASFLARGAGMLVMPFYAFAVPVLVAVVHDRAEVRRRFVRIVAQYAALAALAVAVLGVGSAIVVRALFGARYAAAAPLLLPLASSSALAGLVFLCCQLPVAFNRFGFVAAYALGLAAEIALLALFHDTLMHAALAVIAANALTLFLVACNGEIRCAAANWRREIEERGGSDVGHR